MLRGENHDNGVGHSDSQAHVTRIAAELHNASGRIVVPDTELMFSAKYTKSGADLVLTGQDGHKIILTGYFDQARPADLVTLGGAMLPADVVAKLTISQTPGQYAQAGATAGAIIIGKVERLGGSASVQHANGAVEELKVGDAIQQGDVVETRDGSQLGLSLTDGTAFNMGANARMVLSELSYDANSNANSGVFSLVKGQITFVAGQVAKTGDMRVETPVATMGIRGTTVNTNINADISGNVMSVTYSLMTDPDGHIGSFNVLDRTTGAIIGTITTTDSTFVLTPSANLGILATQVAKTPEQVAQELAVAAAVFPVFLANPANFNNPNVNPQDLQPKSGSHGSGTLQPGSTQQNNGSGSGTTTGGATTTGGNNGTSGTGNGTGAITVTLHINAAPSIFADAPSHLVEAISAGTQGPGSAGSPTAISGIQKVDLDGQVNYDAGALISSGWFNFGNGIFAKLGSYGTASLNTAGATEAALLAASWTNVGGGVFEKSVSFNGVQATLRASLLSDSLTYALDNDKADPLRQIDHPTESFIIPVIDNDLARATTSVTFTIDGRNDPPSIVTGSTDANGAVVEDHNSGLLTDSGIITFKDVELTDAHTLNANAATPTSVTVKDALGNVKLLPTLDSVHGEYLGALSLTLVEDTSDGNNLGTVQWSFSVNNNDPRVQALAVGQVVTQVYTIVIDDGHGGSVQTQITVTITGSNDDPTNSAPSVVPSLTVATGAITERTTPAPSTGLTAADAVDGIITFRDLDLVDTHTATKALDSVVWHKAGGATVSGLTDPGNFSVTLPLNENPNDTSDLASVNWGYTGVDSGYDFLAAGETLVVTYNVTITDNNGSSVVQPVVITITGTNDVPTITVVGTDSAAKGLIETDAGLSTSGTLSVTDVDVTNTVAPSVHDLSLGGTGLGSKPSSLTTAALKAMLSVDSGNVIDSTHTTGTIHWSFASTPEAFNFLAINETLILTYQVRATDSEGATADQNVTVTITGTNDAPDITGSAISAGVTETNTTLTTTGTLNVSDADVSDTVVISVDSVAIDPASTFSVANPLSNAALKAMMAVTSGALAADPSGGSNFNWTFTSGSAGDGAFNFLAIGETLILHYTLKATDSSGVPGTDTQLVTVTITGTNDAPDITGSAISAAKTETDTTLTASGTLNVVDIDLSDTVTLSVDSVSIDASSTFLATNPLSNGTLKAMMAVTSGALTADPSAGSDFNWTFTSGAAGDGAFNFLALGETLILHYTLKATDSSGVPGTDTQVVTVTITGTNDAPDITGSATSAGVTETNTTLSATGTLNVVDTDLSDTVVISVDSVAIDSSSTFLATNPLSNAALKAMMAVTSGALTADPSAGSDFNWTFTSGSAGDGAFNFLALGETLILHYTLKATDSSGVSGTDTQLVTVTITGTNDAPDITGNATSAGVTETNTTLTTTGTLNVVDTDLSDTVVISVDSVAIDSSSTFLATNPLSNAALKAMMAVTSGALAADPSGGSNFNWTFTSGSAGDGAFNFLAIGETLVLNYTLKATDSSGVAGTDTQLVTVTITGTNDAPDITGSAVSASVTETNTTLTTTGTLNVVDTDISDTVVISVDSVVIDPTSTFSATNPLSNATLKAMMAVTSGALAADPAGGSNFNWTFTSGSAGDGAFNFLAIGETLILNYTLKATDSSGVAGTDTQLVTVTITGTNDAPDITGSATSAGVTETNTTLTATGTLNVVDTDLSDTVTLSVDSVAIDGSSTFSATNPLSNAALKAMMAVTSGALAADPSSGSNFNWTFTSGSTGDAAFDFLAAGQTLVLNYTLKATDSSGVPGTDTQLVTVTITGTNDAPDITGSAISAAKTETDTTLTATGTLNVVDTDLSDTVTLSVDSVAIDGSSTFTSTNPLSISVLKAMMAVTSGALAADPSGGSNFNWTFTSGNAGDTAFNFLAAGETLVLNYTLKATDSSGLLGTDTQVVTVTITGTNDAPAINGAALQGNVTETNATISTNGTLSVYDADIFDTVAITVDSVNVLNTGSFNIALLPLTNADIKAMMTVSPATVSGEFSGSDFTWTFASAASGDGAFNFLAAGETLLLQYTLKATDSSGVPGTRTQLVTVTITGTNDAPDITGSAISAGVTETNTTLTTTGTLNVVDTDLSDTVTLSVDSVSIDLLSTFTATNPLSNAALKAMMAVTSGALAADPSGGSNFSWTFTSGSAGDGAFNFLGAGETLVLNYTLKATDSSGVPGTDTQVVTVTITGTNDAPDITGSATSAGVTETDTTLSATGTLNVVDADLSDTVTLSVDSVAIDASSTFSATNPLSNTALKAMMAVTSGALAADPSGGSNFNWTFTSGSAGNTAFNFLAAGQTLVLNYTLKATDSLGVPGTDTQLVTVTITGTNDAPDITGSAISAGVTETNTTLTTTGTLNVVDTDLSDTVTLSVDSVAVDASSTFLATNPLSNAALKAMMAVTSGALAADPSGGSDFNWTFTSGSAGDSAFNFLAAGETLVLNYTLKATDNSGVFGTDTQVVTITITGTNDAPVMSGGPLVGNVTEDSNTVITRQLSASDVDHIATQTWKVVGGTDSHAADYSFALDNLKIVRNATTIVDDDFSSAPSNSGTDYAVGANSTLGTVVAGTDANSRSVVILDAAHAIATTGIGSTIPFVTNGITRLTGTDNSGGGTTLAKSTDFSVEARFDLTIPDDLNEAYGIRLSDRQFNVPVSGTTGNDAVELRVAKNATSGSIQVQLRDIDFQASSGAGLVTTLQNIGLSLGPPTNASVPAGAQIILRLEHVAGSSDISASFDIVDASGAILTSNYTSTSGNFSSLGSIFYDENWTQVQISTSSPTVDASYKTSSYGTVSVDSAGLVTYSLLNGTNGANIPVQQLAAGQTVQDIATIQVTDDKGLSATTTATANIAGVNDRPVIDLNGAVSGNNTSLSYTENDAATRLAPDVSITDIDSADFNGGSLSVSFTAAGTAADQLSIKDGGLDGLVTNPITLSGANVLYNGDIIGTFSGGTNGSSLVVTFTTALATPAAVQALASHILYFNNSDTPSTSQRTVTFTVNDGDGTSNGGTDTAASIVTVSVTAVNDRPVVNANGGSLSYTENGSAAVIDNAVTVSDVDDANLTSATVAITGNFVAGQDVLGFTAQNGITGIYNSTTGVLALSGTATTAQYQAALASVTYFNSSDNPSAQTRTVSYSVDDGHVDHHLSNVATATINVTPVNDTPVIDANASSLKIVVANTTDNTVGFLDSDNGLQTLVSYPAGGSIPKVAVGDVNGDGKLDIVTAYQGVASSANAGVSVHLGNAQGSFGSAITVDTRIATQNTLSLGDLNGDGSQEIVSVNYSSSTADVVSYDGHGGFALTGSFATGGSSPVSSALGDVSGDGILDLVVANYYGNNISVLNGDGHGGFGSPSFLTLVGDPQFVHPETAVVGDLNGDGKLDILVLSSDAHTPTAETISAYINDGHGNFSLDTQFALTVPVNAPQGQDAIVKYSRTIATADVTGDGIADIITLDSYNGEVKVFAGDSGHHTFALAGDFHLGGTPYTLAIGDANGDGTVDIVTADSYASVGGRDIVYILGGDGNGGFTHQALPAGTQGSGPDSVAIAPAQGVLRYIENHVATAIDPRLTVSDVDNATFASATVQITGGLHSAEDLLAFVNNGSTMGNIAAAAYNGATGLLTLTSSGATATLGQWQDALRAVTYSNSSDDPSSATRTISYTVDDGHGGNHVSNVATATVSVVPVNDGPLVASSALTSVAVASDVTVDGAIGFTDVDVSDTHSASFTALNGQNTYLGTFSVDNPVTEQSGNNPGTVAWHFTLDSNGYAAIQNPLEQSYAVRVSDSNGGFTAQTVSLLIGTANGGALTGADGKIIVGGAGVDTFMFAPNFGKQTVANFSQGNDFIELDSSGYADFAALQTAGVVDTSGSNTVIHITPVDVITVLNQHLNSSDFVFA